MFCSKCGNEVSDSVDFCPFCGTKNILAQDNSERMDIITPKKEYISSSEGNPFRAIHSEITDEDRKNVNYERDEYLSAHERTGTWESIKTLVTTILVLAGIVAVIVWVVIPWFKGKGNDTVSNQSVNKTMESSSSNSQTDELLSYLNEYRKDLYDKEAKFLEKYNLLVSLELDGGDQTVYDMITETKELAAGLKVEADKIQSKLKDEKIKKVNKYLVDISADWCKIMDEYDSACLTSSLDKLVDGQPLPGFDSSFRNKITVLMDDIDKLTENYKSDIKKIADEYGVTLTDKDGEPIE